MLQRQPRSGEEGKEKTTAKKSQADKETLVGLVCSAQKHMRRPICKPQRVTKIVTLLTARKMLCHFSRRLL